MKFKLEIDKIVKALGRVQRLAITEYLSMDDIYNFRGDSGFLENKIFRKMIDAVAARLTEEFLNPEGKVVIRHDRNSATMQDEFKTQFVLMSEEDFFAIERAVRDMVSMDVAETRMGMIVPELSKSDVKSVLLKSRKKVAVDDNLQDYIDAVMEELEIE